MPRPVKWNRDDLLKNNFRQLIILTKLVEYRIMTVQEMNDLLVKRYPHLYLDKSPAAQASLGALKRRGYVYKVGEKWKPRSLGERLVAHMRQVFEEDEVDDAEAVAAGGDVVPLKPKS